MQPPTQYYKIVRFYFRSPSGAVRRTLRKGLTLEEAQAHTMDPESSSSTAKRSAARRITRRHGAWFDGYTAE